MESSGEHTSGGLASSVGAMKLASVTSSVGAAPRQEGDLSN